MHTPDADGLLAALEEALAKIPEPEAMPAEELRALLDALPEPAALLSEVPDVAELLASLPDPLEGADPLPDLDELLAALPDAPELPDVDLDELRAILENQEAEP